MDASAENDDRPSPADGLRDRKKARRREKILRHAGNLFEEKGIDATTIADIAHSVGVSPPTIFNYFGNKDGILIALITEGAQKARARDHTKAIRSGTDFGTVLADLFADFASHTLKIASKRIWRYAEAAAIRHPATELARNYATVDEELVQVIIAFLDRYQIRMRTGEDPDTEFLARLFYDAWNTAFFELIKQESLTLRQHHEELVQRYAPLARMLFDDAFFETPKLKTG